MNNEIYRNIMDIAARLSVKSVCGGNNEQGNRYYLRSGYLHYRLPVMGC